MFHLMSTSILRIEIIYDLYFQCTTVITMCYLKLFKEYRSYFRLLNTDTLNTGSVVKNMIVQKAEYIFISGNEGKNANMQYIIDLSDS